MLKQVVAVVFVTGLMTVAIAGSPSTSGADTEAIKSTLTARFPKLQIVDVQPAPMPALYEVYTGREIYYTDKAGDFVIRGTLIDARTQEDLTSTRVDDRNHIDFNSLPFDRAIKIVKGNGSRKLAIFTDPDCLYCRKFEEELKSVSDVTTYVFLFPLKIHPNADRHAKDIWCTNDKAGAWTAYMLEKKEPAAGTCTTDPIAEIARLATKLNISGTPTMYFATGERNTGGMSAEELRVKLTIAGGK